MQWKCYNTLTKSVYDVICLNEKPGEGRNYLLKQKKRGGGEVRVLSEQNLYTFSDNGKFHQV